jgi:Domain of unknown function (DUF4386)
MKKWFTTARVTGLFYFGLLVTGIVGYVMPNSTIYVPHDAIATVNNLLSKQSFAYTSLAGELGIVAFQVLVAIWFFRLFKKVNTFAALSLMVFGLLGAVAILVGLIFSAEAVKITAAPIGGSAASTVLLLWELHEMAWIVGHLFFGLWLIPMGQLILEAKAPRLLGWILILGGIGYVLSGIVQLSIPTAPQTLSDALVSLASVGELWIIIYLLIGKGAIAKLND